MGWSLRVGLLLAALYLTGCLGYQLGPTGGQVAGARSIEIRPFPNQTYEARLSEPVTGALRKSIQKDGTFILNTRGQGDIILNGEIVEYRRVGLTFQPQDVITVRDFELRMTAHVKAMDPGTGEVLLDRNVTGKTIMRSFDDLNSAERQAIPLVAEDLARNITDLLVDGAW